MNNIKNIFSVILIVFFMQQLLFSKEINLSLQEFNNKIKNTFIKPILNKDFYLIKVISFNKLEDFSGSIEWVNQERSLSESGYLDPYRLIFKLKINKLYIKNFENFLSKIAKNILINPNDIPKYSIVISDNSFSNFYDLRKFSNTIKVFQLNRKYFLRFKSIIENFYQHYQARLRIAFLDKKGNLLKEVYYANSSRFYRLSNFKDNKKCEISRSDIEVILPDGKTSSICNACDNHWFFADIHTDHVTFFSKNPFPLSVVFFLGDDDLKYIKYAKIEIQWIKVK